MVRVKKRYITLKVESRDGEPFFAKRELLVKSILNGVKQCFGQFAVALISRSIQVKHSLDLKGHHIIRIPRESQQKVLASVPFMVYEEARISSVHVSGTLRHAYLHSKEQLEKEIESKIKTVSEHKRKKSMWDKVVAKRKKRVN